VLKIVKFGKDADGFLLLSKYGCDVSFRCACIVLVQYRRCVWKKLVYRVVSALGERMCLALFIKKHALDSLEVSLAVLWLKFRCSSR